MNKNPDTIGYWIKRYTALVNQRMDAVLIPYGIGRTQWYILFHIHEVNGLPQRSLQVLLSIESATVTNLVMTLVKKGLVVQEADSNDKRGKRLRLTPAGTRLWDVLPDPINIIRAQAWQGIPAADIAIARSIIEKAVHNLERETHV